MKNKTLKHYNRKKFFYRFFMRKSPRSGAMFGLAWMICFGAILPLSWWIFTKISMAWVYDPTFNFITWVVAAVLFFTGCLLIYAYGFLTFAKNFYTILRNELKKSRFWKIPALISAVWHELAGILLLPIVIKKKRWAGLLFILLSFVFGFLGYMLDTPLQKWWCFHFGVAFMLFCAIGVSGKKGEFQRKAVYPLFGFGLFIIVLLASDFYFLLQIDKSQSALAQVTQCGIGSADWQKRNDSGYSINKEPLKSFCNVDMKIDMEKYQAPAEAKKYLAELRKTHADKFIAIDKLLKLKPQRVSYNWVEPGETPAALLLPDIPCFRTAANLRILEMRANAADKNVIAKCNQDLLQFRTWCLHNETLFGKLLAGFIDMRRLDALSYAMASGVYSKDEMVKLIGDAPDWRRQFSETFASEHAISEDFVNRLKTASTQEIRDWKDSNRLKSTCLVYRNSAPLFVQMNLKRDYLYTLNHYLKIGKLLSRDDLSGIKKAKLAQKNEGYLWGECFIVSIMMNSNLHRVLLRIDQICDVRQMALLAAEVMEYRKQHGKLPEDLSFLPKVPLAKLDHKPLMYEKTKDGFRIFSHTDKGEKPDEKDLQYSYRVSLPEQAELPPEKLITIAEKELVKVYGKQVLKQRPWKITRSDEKSITLTGTFHGQGLGGVAEITLQKSNGKVLYWIHGK